MAIRRRRTGFRGRVIKEDPHRINEKITVDSVRLVGDNVEPAILKTSAALAKARELELDL
ncbi:MAG: translation initiation factor IF-3, partial [Bacteroidota bacterium]|nr:translation initiation factor IF-3 [Bacteroidota bacterium]